MRRFQQYFSFKSKSLFEGTQKVLALLIVFSQVVAPIGPAFNLGEVHASPSKITAKSHQGQKSDLSYTSGNITEYTEGDFIDFRFTLEATHGPTNGQVEVRFTGDDSTCLFFDDSFTLGDVDVVSGATPIVTTVGTPVAQNFGTSNGEWVQTLDIDYPSTFDHGDNETVVNYTLRLSNEAGECNGSSQHSRLNPAGGTVEQTGAQNVPVPANQIIELPEIFVQKLVDRDGDGVAESEATAGEWAFSLNGGTPVPTDSNGEAAFTNVTPDGDHTVTEHNGPTGQSFISGEGTNCTFQDDVATANVQSGTTAQDATCIFNNGLQQGKIIIEKQTLPDGANQLFDFEASYDNDGFSLSDGQTNDSGGLLPGDYSVNEIEPEGWSLTDVDCSDGSDPSSIELSAGETVTCTFTNTKLATIIVEKVVTPEDAGGEFTFTGDVAGTIILPGDNQLEISGLLPDTYTSTETDQSKWSLNDIFCDDNNSTGNVGTATATFNVEVGETVRCTFTNIEHGSIEVIKKVDHDGDGIFEEQNATDWVWTLDGGLDRNTGDDPVAVSEGTYTVAEKQKGDYHVTDLTCDRQSYGAMESGEVIVAPGQDITCTFKNTRDTGTITVRKQINPTDDNGLFDLLIDSTVEKADATHGEGTDTVIVPTGTHSVSEAAGTATVLDDYSTNLVCSNEEGELLNVNETPSGNFDIATDEDVICVFTNTRLGHIIIEKQTLPDGDSQSFDFEASYDNDGFSLKDGQENDSGGLLPDTYSISENVPEGWDLTSAICDDQSTPEAISLQAGETVRCVFTNTKLVDITIAKTTDPVEDMQDFNFVVEGPEGFEEAFLLDTDSTDSENEDRITFDDVLPGTYTITEYTQAGWTLTELDCTLDFTQTNNEEGDSAEVTIPAGSEGATCTFDNTKLGTIIVEKITVPTDSQEEFNFTGDVEGTIGNDQTLEVNNLLPGTYTSTEIDKSKWDLTDIACSDENSEGSIATHTATFELEAGETVTCTFTNAEHGTIIVDKITHPANSEAEFSASIEGDKPIFGDTVQTMTDAADATFEVTAPGTYGISEEAPAGWEMIENTCTELVVEPGETKRCTITNTQYGTITINKVVETTQETDQTFVFTSEETILNGQLNGEGSFTSGEHALAPGIYEVTEQVPDGWDLTNLICSGEEYNNDALATATATIELEAGETVDCTFTNTQRASVTATKYDDINTDGSFDEELEERLPDWTVYLNENSDSELAGETDANGEYAFENIHPGFYGLSEDINSIPEENWNFSNIECTGMEEGLDGETFFFELQPGQELDCFIGNYQDLVLELDKENDQTAPQQVGESIVYTLEVSVPENSGTSFNTVVTDLPPEGIEYVDGSWNAELHRDGATTDLPIGEPTYASPGDWGIGTMLPGDVITLTYAALITDDVSPGDYPDLAFATGEQTQEEESVVVYSNINPEDDAVGTPFVETTVQVVEEQETDAVFAAARTVTITELPNTGPAWLDAILVPIGLASMYYMFARRKWYKQIGGRI